MQAVSTAYQTEMKKTNRGQGYMKITFGLIDIDAGPDAVYSDNDHIYFSRTTALSKIDGVPEASYATFEKDRLRADGKQLIPSRFYPIAQGYVSNAISGADCTFEPCPVISIDFTKTHKCAALTFVFDQTTGDHPSELRVIAWREGAVIVDHTETGIDSSSYVLRENLEHFDRLQLIFIKSSKPYHRARLQQVTFGMGILFENSTINSATIIGDVDPISRRLPANTLDFTVINLNGMYNPDNPKGVWEAIEQQSPVRVEYGQRLTAGLTWEDVGAETWEDMELTDWRTVYEGGGTEWVNCGNYLLDARPTVDNNLVKFKCRDAVAYMTGTYYKGRYQPAGATLYDLAVDVLEDAGLPVLYDDVKPYIVDESLKSIMTTAYLPVRRHNECLQLIAHAGRCILWTDRKGIVRLEPNHVREDNYTVSFDSQYKKPKVEKLPTLREVRTKLYSYHAKPEAEELHKSIRIVHGEDLFLVEYSPAVDIAISASNGVKLTFTPYTSAAEITLRGEGETEIIVTGRALEASSTFVASPVKNCDPYGEVEELDNPLVTNTACAAALGQHVRDYLSQRNTYTLDYRGSPELEANDLIYMQSQFDPQFRARVLKHTLNFNGAVKGSLIMKRTNQ